MLPVSVPIFPPLRCAIDMLAGPSEVLVIADASADVETVAADLLAQVGGRAQLTLIKNSSCVSLNQS